MIIKKETIQKIKDIIDRNYKQLTVSVLGNSVFTDEEIKALQDKGIDVSNDSSFYDKMNLYGFVLISRTVSYVRA